MTGNPILILIMDFLDNLLRDLKEQLDLGPDFYAQVKESHRRILDCMIAEDCVGARREMAADLLAVGDYMAQATGSPPFDPAMLGFSRAALYLGGDNGDSPLESPQRMSTALLKALLGEGVDPEIVKRGMVVKQVASGDLYVIVPRERKESE
jgi:hypothetical protein